MWLFSGLAKALKLIWGRCFFRELLGSRSSCADLGSFWLLITIMSNNPPPGIPAFPGVNWTTGIEIHERRQQLTKFCLYSGFLYS